MLHQIGSRYEATKSLDAVALAKEIRAAIKQLVAAGELPRGKYSVRTRWSTHMLPTAALLPCEGHDLDPENPDHLARLAEIRAAPIRAFVFGWQACTGPIKVCVYHPDTDPGDLDECLFCRQPNERK